MAKEVADGSDHWTEWIVGLRPIFTSFFQTAVRLMGRDPDDDDQAYESLARLVDAENGVPIPFRRGIFETPRCPGLPDDVPESRQHLARYLGHFFGSIARPLVVGLLEGQNADPAGPARGRPHRREQMTAAMRALRGLVPEGMLGDFDRLVRSLERFEREHADDPWPFDDVDLSNHVPIEQSIIDIWQAFAAALRVLCPDAIEELDDTVASALTDVARRMPFALSLTAAGTAHRWETLFGPTSSSRAMGNEVHRVIESTYETAHQSTSDIVAEAWYPTLRRSMITVRGPITRHIRKQLNDIANTAQDRNLFFQCARTGFSSHTPITSLTERSLRSDLIDRSRRMVWEIKPLRGTAAGVLQEARYRVLFNLTRLMLRCLRLPHPPPLQPGGDALGASAMTPIDVTRQAGGEPAFALPFQLLPELDGLILYLVFRAGHDATTSTVLIRLLQRELERWRRQQRESDDNTGGATPAPAPVGRRDSFEIDWALVLIVIIVLIIIVLVLMAFGGAVAAVVAAIAAALAALGGSPGVVPLTPPTDDFGDGLAAVWSLAAGLMDVRLTPERDDERTESPVQVKFAGMKIHGLPRDRVVPLFGFLGAALPGARWIYQHYLRRELDQSRRGSQAVS